MSWALMEPLREVVSMPWPGRMAFEAEGTANTKALTGTEFSMGMRGRGERRVRVKWGWSRSQVLLDLKDYDKKFRFLIKKGIHWKVRSRENDSWPMFILVRSSLFLCGKWNMERKDRERPQWSFKRKMLVQLFIGLFVYSFNKNPLNSC